MHSRLYPSLYSSLLCSSVVPASVVASRLPAVTAARWSELVILAHIIIIEREMVHDDDDEFVIVAMREARRARR